MSRWRAAPPTANTDAEAMVSLANAPHVPVVHQSSYTRLSHFSSPLSLAPYRLFGPNEIPLSPPLVGSEPQQLSASSGPTLPVELYRMIVRYLTSQRDLCTLARVSRAFQVEAERVLYHSLYLRHHIGTLWRCESLATQPRLALHVRKLSITVDQYTPFDSIARALACCAKLRSLSLRGAEWSDYSKVLDSVRSTEIREFACHARGEAGVMRFLERQPDLVEVDLEAHGFDLEELSSFSVPRLQAFTGWLTTAAALAPGRPIHRLTLTSDMANDATIKAVGRLSEGINEVLSLDIRLGVLREPIPWTILESILISLKGLKFLGVCNLDCARHPSFPFYLMALPQLQTLVFGTNTDDFGKYDEHFQRELVYRLGHACESLNQVIISLTMWKSQWIWTRSIGAMDPFNGLMGSRQEWWGTLSREPVDLDEFAKLHCPVRY